MQHDSVTSVIYAYLLMLTGNSSDKVKMLNMGQHILDSLDTPQQLYQVCYPVRSHVCRAWMSHVTNTKQCVQLLCALPAYAVNHRRAFACTPAIATKCTVDAALAAHEATALFVSCH